MSKAAYIIVGRSLCGKGTGCKPVARHHQFPYIELGDKFRRFKSLHPDDHRVEAVGGSGYGDSKLAIGLAQQEISKHHQDEGIFLDGMPRDFEQAEWLLRHLKAIGRRKIFTVWFSTPPQICYTRPPRPGREAEDSLEIRTRKMETFRVRTLPIKPFLQGHTRFFEIDNSSLSPASTAQLISRHLRLRLSHGVGKHDAIVLESIAIHA